MGDGNCRQREVVGEELEALPRVDVEIAHAPQRVRVRFRRVDSGQNDGVIGAHAGGLVHWVGVAALEQDVGFRAHNEEGRAEREAVEALEIDVAAVHDVERPGLGQDLVENIHIVHLAVRNADERGDVAVQIQQGVHLDGALVLAELGPRKQREA